MLGKYEHKKETNTSRTPDQHGFPHCLGPKKCLSHKCKERVKIMDKEKYKFKKDKDDKNP